MGRPRKVTATVEDLVEQHRKTMKAMPEFRFWSKRHLPMGSENPPVSMFEEAYGIVQAEPDQEEVAESSEPRIIRQDIADPAPADD